MERECLFSEKKVTIGTDSGYDNYIMAIESSCDETASHHHFYRSGRTA